VLHVQQASANGIVRFQGQSFADVQQVLCADVVIITAEEIVPEQELRAEPERNLIPYFAVNHVCHVPYGAHPYAVFNYYDYDPLQLRCYHTAAEEDQAFTAYLDRYVYLPQDHRGYLKAIGGQARLDCLRAAEGYGYRPDLRRRELQA
jgi:glutaconate CoA-transferase subunit A